jgi:hypothetical protein
MVMGALTVRVCTTFSDILADKITDNEFVQLMMQK